MGKWRYKKKSKMFTYRQRMEIDSLSKLIHCNMEQKQIIQSAICVEIQ